MGMLDTWSEIGTMKVDSQCEIDGNFITRRVTYGNMEPYHAGSTMPSVQALCGHVVCIFGTIVVHRSRSFVLFTEYEKCFVYFVL